MSDDLLTDLRQALVLDHDTRVRARRFVTAGCAGGLIATLTFLGTLLGENVLAFDPRWFFVPILSFLGGLTISWFGVMQELQLRMIEMQIALIELSLSLKPGAEDRATEKARMLDLLEDRGHERRVELRYVWTAALVLITSTAIALCLLWLALTPSSS